jgi:dCTP deaminase
MIDNPDLACINGAAYRLKVGREYYVSPTELDADRNTRTLKALAVGETFKIPPGQFALVLTEELPTMPPRTLGFFSIRPRVKWKGLVNVSGFHIDPGFSGRLTIAVYNASPAPIHLRQGEPEFPVWFADLDGEAEEKDAIHEPTRTRIDVGVLNQAPVESESLRGLSAKMDNLEKKVGRMTWSSPVH